jgi:thiol-disulfide isomerase/thioredoxin/YHS domain-containing protein
VALADPTAASVWKNDFAAAEAEAKMLNRPLVVHFHATYCAPCKLMEKEVLFTPQVLKLLEAGFVAVKVDVPKNPKVSARFAISSMPTDIIVGPDGKVLVKTEGYTDVAHAGDDRDRRKYLANLSRISSQIAAAEAKSPAGSNSAQANKNGAGQRDSRVPVTKDRALASTAPVNRDPVIRAKDKLVPPANKVDPPAGSPTNEPSQQDELRKIPETSALDEVLVAMDGYCPVTLRTTRTWTAGDKAISLEHEGQMFYFTAVDKRDEFKAHPARYAPRLLGCDPVTLAENDVAVRGSTQFGAFYDGALFLFESADSRTKFRKAPARYSQLKHVVKPEDVKKVASTVDP